MSDVEQIHSLLLQQKEELFQRLDSWLLKAEGALSRSATWPRDGIVAWEGGGLRPGGEAQRPGGRLRWPPGSHADSSVALRLSSEEVGDGIDHMSSKKTLRQNMTTTWEYEEAKDSCGNAGAGERPADLHRYFIQQHFPHPGGLHDPWWVTSTWAKSPSRRYGSGDSGGTGHLGSVTEISNSIFLGIQLEIGTYNEGNVLIFLAIHLQLGSARRADMLGTGWGTGAWHGQQHHQQQPTHSSGAPGA
eukprot:Skav203014  [mRNA]  locus=scaffold583:57427:63994:+ [translate_table: standard]